MKISGELDPLSFHKLCICTWIIENLKETVFLSITKWPTLWWQNIQALEVYSFFVKKYSSTPRTCQKFSRAFGTHPNPFISDDVCCYSQYWTMIRATTFPQFMEQFCSLIKTRLRMAANVIIDEEIRMGSQKLCQTFSKLLVLKNTFYNMLSQQMNLHSVTCILFLTWERVLPTTSSPLWGLNEVFVGHARGL